MSDQELVNKLEAKISQTKFEINKTKNILSVLEKSLSDLEIAARVLREMVSDSPLLELNGRFLTSYEGLPFRDYTESPDESAVANAVEQGASLAGKTVLDCTTIILAEAEGRELHYQEIADEAIRRGYREARSNNAANIRKIFSDTLRKLTGDGPMHCEAGVLEFVGHGKFKLALTEQAKVE
jgi:hypothetical protein